MLCADLAGEYRLLAADLQRRGWSDTHSIPMLVIRGEHTDILSANVIAKMADNHLQLHSLEVKNPGPAHLLSEPGVETPIRLFLKDKNQNKAT